VLAAAFAIVMPPLQLNDEHGHFVRAYQISRGAWKGDPAPALPPAVIGFLMRYPEGFKRERYDLAAEVRRAFSRGESAPGPEARAHDDTRHRYITWSILASSLYCPVVYLPSAAGIATARAAGLPPAGMLYAARLFNALLFALALWIALRLAPGSRALMAAIGLMPMTLHQAGGVSADSATIAISLVGFALILRVRAAKGDSRFLIALACVMPIWVLCKTSAWALPLLLLIPSYGFANRWRRALYIAGVVLAAFAVLAMWQHATRGNLTLFRADRLVRGMDTSGNLGFVKAHPLQFARMLGADVTAHFGEHTGQFIGAFGWNKLMLSMVARVLYFGLILFAARFDTPGWMVTPKERLGLAALFVATLLATYVGLFAIDGVVTARGIEFPYSAGVQGRYFIPFCLTGFLALRRGRETLDPGRVLRIVVCAAGVFDLLSLAVIWNWYYA
jgi:uncharacterized membrane protein